MKKLSIMIIVGIFAFFLTAAFGPNPDMDVDGSRPLVTTCAVVEPTDNPTTEYLEYLCSGLPTRSARKAQGAAMSQPEEDNLAESNDEVDDSAELEAEKASLLWMGWTTFESGEESWSLTASDDGHAYGRYQFDDRHCLADFVRFCVEEDRDNYESFTTFYWVDGQGKSHIKNTERLPEEWNWICYLKGEDFYDMQTKFALKAYYKPAKACIEKACKVDLDDYGPVLRGTMMSLAIRNGTYASGLQSAINTYQKGIDEREWLQEIYAAEAAHHPKQVTRWGTTQKQAALRALTAFEETQPTKKGLKKLKTKYSFEPIL